MASTKLNGTKIGLYYSGSKIGAATSHSLSLQTETADVTTKDSAGWKEIIPTLKSFTIDMDALLTYDETVGYEALMDAMTSRTPVYFKLSTEVTGDEKFYGMGYITSLEQNAPQEDATTYSCSIEGSGALTRATVT